MSWNRRIPALNTSHREHPGQIPAHQPTRAPYFPTEGLYLGHGDDLYSSLDNSNVLLPLIPRDALFIDEQTWQSWYGPQLTPEQRLANISKKEWDVLITYPSDRFVIKYCHDVHQKILDPAQGSVYYFFKDRYSVGELQERGFWDTLDKAAQSVGGCLAVFDWEAAHPGSNY